MGLAAAPGPKRVFCALERALSTLKKKRLKHNLHIRDTLRHVHSDKSRNVQRIASDGQAADETTSVTGSVCTSVRVAVGWGERPGISNESVVGTSFVNYPSVPGWLRALELEP